MHRAPDLIPTSDMSQDAGTLAHARLIRGLDLVWRAAGERATRPGTHRCHPHMSPPFPGTYVTRAEATDADDPETDNAALRYSILEQGGPQLFSIDPHTGEIRTVQVGLDREVRPRSRTLTAEAGQPPGEGSECRGHSVALGSGRPAPRVVVQFGPETV